MGRGAARLTKAVKRLPEPLTPIGRVRDGAGVTIDGKPYEGPTGWEHFR